MPQLALYVIVSHFIEQMAKLKVKWSQIEIMTDIRKYVN